MRDLEFTNFIFYENIIHGMNALVSESVPENEIEKNVSVRTGSGFSAE